MIIIVPDGLVSAHLDSHTLLFICMPKNYHTYPVTLLVAQKVVFFQQER